MFLPILHGNIYVGIGIEKRNKGMRDNRQMSDILGAEIKKIRQEQGLTLGDLAEKTGLSSGFISKVERNLSKPSINNIQRICYALNITIEDLAPSPQSAGASKTDVSATEGEPMLLIPKDKRSLIYNLNNMVKLESILADSPKYKLESLTLSGDRVEYMSSKHQHDEVGVVSCGKMEICLNGEKTYIMEEGDAFLIPHDTEHTLRKLSDETCISFWFKLLKA